MSTHDHRAPYLCAWCFRPLPVNDLKVWYCDGRCRQARRDWRRGRGGRPGIRPRTSLFRSGQ